MTSFPSADARPILIVPYMWIGDFVRCHSVVKVLKSRWPDRPVDVLTTALCRPLADYMPGLRQAILGDLPRSRISFPNGARQRAVSVLHFQLHALDHKLTHLWPIERRLVVAPPNTPTQEQVDNSLFLSRVPPEIMSRLLSLAG